MLTIPNFLIQLGFQINVHSDYDFNGSFLKEKDVQINIICSDSIIGIQAEFKGLKRTLIDSSKINSVNDLVFILSKNIFFSRNFKFLLQEMIQLQTLSDVKHS
tara:strand:- start:2 stop:310 length:309 start_codon:yes stop_codon:yes gene_type:complete